MQKDESTYLGRPSRDEQVYVPDPRRYEAMDYRRCGESGLRLPLLTLGLWQHFGDEASPVEARRLLTAAFDAGITHFDLANNYGRPPGSAERLLGRVLREDLRPYRDQLIISTKAGYDMWPGPYGEWGSRKYLVASLDQSLQRLGLDYVDIFYSHRYDPSTPLEETMSALAQVQRQGKALYVGISSYGPEETEAAARWLASMGCRCLVHQPSYSLFNRWIETTGLLARLRALGIGCLTFTALEQGLLTGKYLEGVPPDSRIARPGSLLTRAALTAEVQAALRGLDAIARRRGQTLAQMALAWTLRDPVVCSTLVGVRTLDQLQENLGALRNLAFSPEELAEIDQFAVDRGLTLWPPNA
jgi:L-glyceraldehyde 3-phosphate reductase